MTRSIPELKRDKQLHKDTLANPAWIRSGKHRENVQESLDKCIAELESARERQ